MILVGNCTLKLVYTHKHTQEQQIEKIVQRELMYKRKKCNDIAFDTGKFIIFYMSPLWLFVIWCPFRLNHCICIIRNEGILHHKQHTMY